METKPKSKVSLKPSEAQFIQDTCISAASRPTETEIALGQRIYEARLAFAQRHNVAAKGLARLDLSEARKDGLGWLSIMDQNEVLGRTEQSYGHDPADNTERHCIDVGMSPEEKRNLLRRAAFANARAMADGLNPEHVRDRLDEAFRFLQEGTEERQAEDPASNVTPAFFNDPEMHNQAFNNSSEQARVTLSVTHGIMSALHADPSLRDN